MGQSPSKDCSDLEKAQEEIVEAERREADEELRDTVLEHEENLKQARQIINNSVIDAAQLVADALEDGPELDKDDVPGYKLGLDSAHKILKYSGIDVDRHELTGKDGTPLFQPLQIVPPEERL